MPISIDSINQLKTHLEGVMERSDHHAQNVYKSVPVLVGLIIWKANSIEARTHTGKNANMIWFTTEKQRRYAIVFNHIEYKIEIRENSQQGRALLYIDNSTSFTELLSFFEAV